MTCVCWMFCLNRTDVFQETLVVGLAVFLALAHAGQNSFPFIRLGSWSGRTLPSFVNTVPILYGKPRDEQRSRHR